MSWLSLQQWGLRRLDGLAARRARLMGRKTSAAHLATGLLGEREALFHLRRLGYVIVAQRWRAPPLRGDVDLIAWEGEHLCFIEVKTRSRRDPMEPAESAVGEEKQRMLRRMAKAYRKGFRQDLREHVRVRFDVVSVYLIAEGTEFEVRRGAFEWE
jgi:putative endonuclease